MKVSRTKHNRDGELVKRTVRLPLDLTVKLEQAAEENRRSVNAEIVYRLERSLDVPAKPVS